VLKDVHSILEIGDDKFLIGGYYKELAVILLNKGTSYRKLKSIKCGSGNFHIKGISDTECLLGSYLGVYKMRLEDFAMKRMIESGHVAMIEPVEGFHNE